MKRKISVALTPRHIDWATERAKRFGVSLSAVMSEAMERYRLQSEMAEHLEGLGTDDITKEDMDALYAELRGAGLRV